VTDEREGRTSERRAHTKGGRHVRVKGGRTRLKQRHARKSWGTHRVRRRGAHK
jgi:hypothetical protein